MALDTFQQAPDEGADRRMPAPYVQGTGLSAAGSQRPDHGKLIAWIKHPNIATEIDDSLLNAIGQRVIRERQIDLDTTSEWRDRSRAAMDLAMQVAKAKSSPWPGASNIIFPLMTTAAMQFAARAYPAIVQGRNVVKGVVVGPDTGTPQIGPDGTPVVQMSPQGAPQIQWVVPPGAKRARANKIGEHMSWQLLSEMTEWEEETDKLLHILPIVGCCFRKSFFDRANMCNASMMILPANLIINYWAKSMERAPRITEDVLLYPLEIEEMVRAGLFIEHYYGPAEGGSTDEDAPHQFAEQHRFLDLDEDGYAEPYIVTTHQQTGKVARIVARYDTDGVHINRSSHEVVRIDPVHYFTKYDFLPNPEGGIYGVGFGQLLGPINDAVNTTLNMLFDAGHLAVTGGGFIGRGLSMHSGSVRFKPGEYKIVNAPGQVIRDAIVDKQYPGPSPVLMSLLGTLIEAGREVASVKDVLEGQTNAASMQPTTLLALIEQGLKVFSAIYKRVHRAAKKEYDKLYRLNRLYLETIARFQVGDEWKTITKADYEKGAGVEPVSDPAMVSDMQKMARTQFLLGFKDDPRVRGLEVLRESFTNAAVDNPERFLNTDPPPPNPVLQMKLAEAHLDGLKAQAQVASERAGQIKDYTQAVLNLANADKAVGESQMGWLEQQIDILRLRLEAANGTAAGSPQNGPGGQSVPASVDNHPLMKGLPGPPGGGTEPGLNPPGQEGMPGDNMDQAPFPGAKRAPDGHWYIGDPARMGKYLRVASATGTGNPNG